MAAQSSTAFPNFVSSTNLPRVHCPIVQAISEDISSSGLSIKPKRAPLVTGLQLDFMPLITTV